MQYRPSRQATRYDVTLKAEGEVIRATIRNISRDGAKVSVQYPLLAGTAVYLKVGAKTFKALVHWCRDGNAGLRFFDRLDRDTMVKIEASAVAASKAG